MKENRSIKKTLIGGVTFTNSDLESGVNDIFKKIEDGQTFFALPFNLRHFERLRSDDKILKEAIDKAEHIFADGMPVVWASKLVGSSLPCRVTGCDLGRAVVVQADQLKVFLLATNDEGKPVGERAANVFSNQGLNVRGITQNYQVTKKGGRIVPDKVDSMIRSWKPDIVMVGLGGRAQEEWILKNQDKYNIPFCMGVGGSMDIWSGHRKRAPIWMQNIGLEWFYQIINSPKKIKRYLKELPILVWLILNSIKRKI